MYRVALNVAIQDFRNEKKHKFVSLESLEWTEQPPDITHDIKNEQLQLLEVAIGNLDKIERAIMMLHLDGVSNEEIAQIVGITQNYVRVKMTRIRKKLAKTLIKD